MSAKKISLLKTRCFLLSCLFSLLTKDVRNMRMSCPLQARLFQRASVQLLLPAGWSRSPTSRTAPQLLSWPPLLMVSPQKPTFPNAERSRLEVESESTVQCLNSDSFYSVAINKDVYIHITAVLQVGIRSQFIHFWINFSSNFGSFVSCHGCLCKTRWLTAGNDEHSQSSV